MNHLQNAMECILFAHGEPVKGDDLAKVLQVDPSLIEKEMEDLIDKHREEKVNYEIEIEEN